MQIPHRIQEHVALMSRGAIALSGAGGFAGVYGLYKLIEDTHGQSAWFWLFSAFFVLFLAQIQAVQRALRERDEARAQRDAIQRTVDQREDARLAPVYLTGLRAEAQNIEEIKLNAQKAARKNVDLEG